MFVWMVLRAGPWAVQVQPFACGSAGLQVPKAVRAPFLADEGEGSATADNLYHKPVGTCRGNGLSHLTKL